jgi:hypothetical protein
VLRVQVRGPVEGRDLNVEVGQLGGNQNLENAGVLGVGVDLVRHGGTSTREDKKTKKHAPVGLGKE